MARKPRVYIGVGHGGSDPGAVGYLVEKDVNLKMALALKNFLDANGVDTKISRTNDKANELSNRIREADAWNADLAIDVHNNAGGGDGAEVLYSIVGGTGKVLAQNILDELIKIGQNSRGIKTRVGSGGLDYFGFIRDTNMPAVITESAFVDTKADAAQIDEAHEQKAFGEAIGKGTLKTLKQMGFELTATPVSKPTTNATTSTFKPYLVKKNCDVLNIRSGAGTNYNVVGQIDKNNDYKYTIVEEKAGKGSDKGWGKLKSGAGWISLDWVKKV